MEQKKKDLSQQQQQQQHQHQIQQQQHSYLQQDLSQQQLLTSQIIKEREIGELKQKALAQRLYAKYSDTGNIIPNKLVGNSQVQILSSSRRSIFTGDEQLQPMGKKSSSVMRNSPSMLTLTSPSEGQLIIGNEQNNNGRKSQIRAKLPQVQTRRHIDFSQTPLPTLPFPRVLGKDIISPFPGSQDHSVLKRIIAQHQAQAMVLADNQTLSTSQSQQNLGNSIRQGGSGSLPTLNQSHSTLKLGGVYAQKGPSQILSNSQSLLQLQTPAEKTLAILDQHQRTQNRGNASQMMGQSLLQQSQSYQQLAPLDQSRILNQTLDQTSNEKNKFSTIMMQQNQQQQMQQQQKPLSIEGQIKKDNTDIKKYMKRKGLKPSPLEFIRLVQMDSDFQNRFCYCNRKEDYYEFEIVPFNDRNEDEYMTVSSRGVVHFIRQEANFMTIPEWEREQRIYKKIQNIPFFEKYRTWKTFSAWKTLMRRTMIFKTSDFLNRELFILDSELSKPLLDIRMQTFNISKMQMVLMTTDRPKYMPDFYETQERQRKNVSDGLAKIEKVIKNLLIESCDNSMRTFKEENRISLNDNQEEDDNEEAEPFLVGDETHKQMPYTQEATTRTHYKKLAKYIRLTDYMLIDSKLRLIQNSISNVLKVVQLDLSQGLKYAIGDKWQVQPLFEVEVDFKGTDIYFTPNKYDIRDAIKNSITDGVNTVCRYELFLNSPELEIYVNAQEQEEHLFDEQNDLMSLAIGSDSLIRDTEMISHYVDIVYDEIQVFSKYYEYYVDIYNVNTSMNVDDFRSKDHDHLNQTLKTLELQSEEIDKFEVKNSIKIVRLDATEMRQRIKVTPLQCNNKIKEFIPKFQFEKLDTLCEILKIENVKMSQKPKSIDQFVGVMKNIKALNDKFDSLTEKFLEIEQYNIIIEQSRINMPDKNKSKFKETQSLLMNTRKKMEEGLENGEVDELRFKKELIDIEIPKINNDCKILSQAIQDPLFDNVETDIEDAVQQLELLDQRVNQMKDRGKLLNTYQQFLEMEETPFESVDNVFMEFNLKSKLWNGLKDWISFSKECLNTKFKDIIVDDIQKQVDKFDKAANQCAYNLKDNPVTTVFRDRVEEIKSTMPVVTYLRDETLQDRHWNEIYEILGMTLNLQDDEFTLSSLIELNVKKDKDKLGEISLKANKEKELDNQFKNIQGEWKNAQIETKLHKDAPIQYYILGKNEDLYALLEESMVNLSNILGARFVDIIRGEVEQFYKKLQYFEQLLEEWQTCQRSWMYLENIFNGGGQDIIKNMPIESKKFGIVDQSWREIMKNTFNIPYIMKLTTVKEGNHLDVFKSHNAVLDDIQKQLEALLDKKRGEFPRFYFLSNDELLSILAEASQDPECVQAHLRKLFENINRISIEDESITKIISAEQEMVVFGRKEKVKLSGQPVERWLNSLMEAMIDAVKKFIREAFLGFKEENEDFKRHDWVMDDFQAQGICVVSSIMWCSQTEMLLKEDEDEVKESLEWWYQENVNQLTELTKIVSRSELDQKKRKAVVALITQDVHYRDILEQLIASGVSNYHDFKWQQQLRYYYDNNILLIKQVNATLDYGHEYMGATTRLVITPLTDRCWMTITGALQIRLGAAPAGPAGTGKTESTKDLAKGLGKFCVVFNCSDQINYRMMEQLFTGLASTGSWACLDEFNRIDIEVLSVIAQQILQIRNAMLADKDRFEIGKRTVLRFDKSMGIFITMNPGYKGRTELPDNLKVLFRPVSMMIPDYALIAEIMLFAEGFTQAKPLSRKMTKLYKLASEQLSQQAHYDFGMRAVKSVLVMAGQVKRNNPKMPEDFVLIRAMRDSNIPKFIKDDLPLFEAIIKDLFPTSQLPQVNYDTLINAIREVQKKEELTHDDDQVEKIIQFYETMNVRFGLMIIGETLTGKSTIIRSLKNAMNFIKNEQNLGVESETLNPKSISLDELYGSFSVITQEWTDGLASQLIRGFVSKEHLDMKWVIFDGPVDAIWIENMNTVLDDNMTLCLSSGERVRLRPEMRMMFEVDDLSQASPATVSRCGMVYASPSTLNWRPIVYSWIHKMPETILTPKLKEQLTFLFETHIDNTIELVRGKKFKEPIPCVDNNYIISLCRLFQTIVENVIDLKKYELDRLKKAVNMIFIYSLAWSFGGSIDSQHYSSFEVYLGTAFNISDLPKTSIFDNQFQMNERLEYVPWTYDMPKFEYNKNKSFFELVVPTKDTVRFSWLLKHQIINGNPVFFTGITGVGKSIIVESTIQQMKKDLNYETIMLTFSSQTSSKEVQNQIEDKLEKRRKNLLAGPNGKKVVLFIDDVNMPAYDEYGTQMPIELLRQFADFKGLYDREGLHWKKIDDTNIICAAAPPEGGRKVLSKRFTRHFHMICLPPTQEESLQMIFQSIIEGFLKDFIKDVSSLSKQMVDCSLLIFQKISKELRPTPAKSHYTFNLRDISKVFQGICMAKTQTLNKIDKMVKLWIHESSRVFHDRLINADDKKWFNELVIDMAKNVFRMEFTLQDFHQKPLIFGDFMKRGIPFEDRQYDEVKDLNSMSQCILDYQEEYNLDHMNKFDLVLFPECLQHIARICRILRQPRGNALLVGVGGSGKQTLTRLAAFIADCAFSTLEVKKDYKQSDFRDNLKSAMKPCGILNMRTTFLINDNQITNESFLEDINNLLNSGEIPNLWLPEDRDYINNELRQTAQDNGVYENIYNYFVQRMRDCLHIVLCLSPVGEQLRKRIRMFPSLVNCCAINWVNTWPEEALLSVSQRFIKKIDFIKEEQLQIKISKMCVFVHQSVEEESQNFYDSLRRRVYITPKSYLDLIKSYQVFLADKHLSLSSRRNILFTGLSKLEETNVEVIRMNEELTKLQPILEISVGEAQILSVKLEKDKFEANKKKMVVEEEKKIVDKKAAEVSFQYNIAMKELNDVLPILQEAEAALNTLNAQDIAVIKGVNTPGDSILATIRCIYMFLKKVDKPKDIEWKDCKQLMSGSFLEKLKQFNRNDIPKKVINALDKFIAESPEMSLEQIKKSSEALLSLGKWMFAILNYAKVAKLIEPKKQMVDLMDAQLKQAQSDLNAKSEKLRDEMKKVEELERAYTEVKDKKDRLENEIELCRQKLIRAEKLVGLLESEHGRWKENIEILDQRIQQLVGDVFISAACVSYYGPFTGVFRDKLVDKWVEYCKVLEVPVSEKFVMQDVMGDPMEIQSWNLNTLPSDQVSICNGILVKYGTRKPLMIDPQQQATRWIKTMYSEENIVNQKNIGALKITRMGSRDMIKMMEQCIKNGYQLLIEDMGEQTEPAFEPVLLNQVFKSTHGREQMQFGDSIIDYDSRFKLYMTTKMPNPHYLPEVFIRVTVINFTVTQEGLEQQLLAEIVKLENPAVENKKLWLTRALVNDQKEMKSIEDGILNQLVNAGSNILEDDELINNLENAKETSKKIKKNMEENEVAQIEIEQARSIYQIVAARGSILYFVIADLSGIDPMYQYSLSYFLRLVNVIIQQSEVNSDIEVRISILMSQITKIVYNNICRGLFNTHKLIFAFLIGSRILLNKKEISVDEWDLYLKGVIMDHSQIKQTKNTIPQLITEKQWKFILNLECISQQFEGLSSSINSASDQKQWKEWLSDRDAQKRKLPGLWEEKLSLFQRMLIFKAMKEEKLVFKNREFVETVLGRSFAHPTPVSMDEVFADSDNKTPIIFVLSSGAEPTALFLRFAKKMLEDKPDGYQIISLGQGQDEYALKQIEYGIKNGTWVLLQNCHLFKSFMPRLEKEVLDISENSANIDPNFRLFLTSMPVPYFPVPILQNGIKITNEPPKGIKSNIIGSLSQLSEETISGCTKRDSEYRSLIYSVCFFHAVIQERRKFGPLGWNIKYEFNESDLLTALTVMKGMLNEEGDDIVWEALQFITGEIVYGGRVTDDIDRRTIMMILTSFISEDIMKEGYKFSESGVYTPAVAFNSEDLHELKLAGLLNKARNLPDIDNPEIFGMNDNADIAFQLQESITMIELVLSVQPRTGGTGSGGKNTDQIIEELAIKIESELPELLTREGAFKELFIQTKDGLLPSLTTFLLQEVERFNKLVQVIATSLDTLKKAIKGLAVMGEDMDKMYKSMLNNKVPELWSFYAYPSLKPLSSWVENLKLRIEFLRMWLLKGKIAAYWLPAFFFPQGFLTALLQSYARKYQIAIDALSFGFQFQTFYELDEVDSSAGDGVFFYGLFMESGQIDKNTLLLVDSSPGQKLSIVPMIHFKPERDHKMRNKDYLCPVFKTTERAGTLSTTGHSTNFVIMVEVPSKQQPKHWVLRGTAMFCQLDD